MMSVIFGNAKLIWWLALVSIPQLIVQMLNGVQMIDHALVYENEDYDYQLWYE